MRDDLLYSEWKKELGIWSDFTDLEKKRQGGALFLTLTGKAREAVLSGVTRDTIKSDTGVAGILVCLDELYLKDKSQSAFAAFDEFTSYRRRSDISIQDYIIEFNLKYNKIKTFDMSLPEGVLAYYLLKCANISDDLGNMCKATCTDLTYKNMRTQIEKVTSNVTNDEKVESFEIQPQFYGYEDEDYSYDYNEYFDEEQSQDTYYNQYNPRNEGSNQQWQGRSSESARTQQRTTASTNSTRRQNPLDEFGNPSRCGFCRSIYHWIEKCPDAPPRSQNYSQRRGPRRSYRGRGFSRGPRGAF